MDREKVVSRNNPSKREFEFLSPFTVGNGSIAYTADVTGMQTLYEEQAEAGFPLLTMADWAWHTTPTVNGETYELDRDLVMTKYAHPRKGTVHYAVEKQPGNEEVYDWLRENPHRYNLLRIGLYYKKERIRAEQITGIDQSLDLYTGILTSNFELRIGSGGHAKESVDALQENIILNPYNNDIGKAAKAVKKDRTPKASVPVQVKTLCHQEQDVLAFEICSELCKTGDLQVVLQLPYGSSDITGSDWNAEDRHETKVYLQGEHTLQLLHSMDGSGVSILVCSEHTNNWKGKAAGASLSAVEHLCAEKGYSADAERPCVEKNWSTAAEQLNQVESPKNWSANAGVIRLEQLGKHSYLYIPTGSKRFAFTVELRADIEATNEERSKAEENGQVKGRFQKQVQAVADTQGQDSNREQSISREQFKESAIGQLQSKNCMENTKHITINPTFHACEQSSICKWKHFWQEGGLISFEHSTDPRTRELERRIILSLYVSAINSCNSMPPQETGLTVNSWYGKAHLEMYLWHLAYLPLWGRSDLLKKSLGWFKRILPEAIKNAKRNDYRGAKWPKMVGPQGVDCPSIIATLLVWQQPHLIYMLELMYQTGGGQEVLKEYWELVKESAEYMADFAEYNQEKQVYELVAPLIPAQESHRPEDTKNPVYEIEYWRLGLTIAIEWAKRLDEPYPAKWQEVAEHMAMPAAQAGVYLAHECCPETYTQYAKDHPSMVAALGLLPGERIDPQAMKNTLKKIRETWDFQSMWGWDFAMLAMTETRLGNPAGAIDILLYDTEKNRYMGNGHNLQASRNDLPLYLPGNGSLLLAIPLMAVGYPSCDRAQPGFPDDGTWQVEVEGIYPFMH